MSNLAVVSIVGNPRPESRTHAIARALINAISEELWTEPGPEIDLAALGARTLDPVDPAAISAVEEVLEADVLVVAIHLQGHLLGAAEVVLRSDRHGCTRGQGRSARTTGGAANHQLAVDVHFTPLLLELGAAVPVRGLFVIEADLEQFPAAARTWARRHAAQVVAALPTSQRLERSNR